MVFNPSLEGGVRFDQPVSQGPSSVETLAQVVGGLFGGGGGGGDSLTEGERFNRAVAQFVDANGGEVSPNPGDWTERTLREFSAFNPHFGGRAFDLVNERIDLIENQNELEEQQGGGESRLARVNFREWRLGAEGLAARTYAENRFDSEAEVEAHLLRRYSDQLSQEATISTLEREDQLSEAFWTTNEDEFLRQTVEQSQVLLPFFDRIARGESVQFSEIPGFADVMGPDEGTITAGNIGTVFSQYRSNLRRHFTRQMQESGIGAGRTVNAPPEEVIENILSPISDMVTALQSDDPNAQLDRLNSRDALRAYEVLGTRGRVAVQIMNLAGGNNLPLNDRIIQMMDENGTNTSIIQGLEAIAAGDPANALTPEDAAAMGVGEAQESLSLNTSVLSALMSSGDATPEAIQSTLSNVRSLAERAGQAIPPSVYRSMLSRNGVSVINGNTEVASALNQFVMFDMEQDVSDLSQMVNTESLGLRFEDGEFVIDTSQMRTATGESLGELTLRSEGQAILNRINEKISVLQTAGLTDLVDSFAETVSIEQQDVGTTFEEIQSGEVFSRDNSNSPFSGVLDRTAESVQSAEQFRVQAQDVSEQHYGSNLTELEFGSTLNPRTPIYSTGAAVTDRSQAHDWTVEDADNTIGSVLNSLSSVQEQTGFVLPVLDALPTPQTNRAVEGHPDYRPGSLHFQGAAADIAVSHLSNDQQMQLLQSLMEAGFQGFGFGNGMIHVDFGQTRTWNYGNDTWGGVSVNELSQMVSEGAIPRDALVNPGSNPNIPTDTVDPSVISTLTSGSAPGEMPRFTGGTGIESDPDQGQAQNLTFIGELFTESQELPNGRVEGRPDEEGEPERDTRDRAPEQIESLIQRLTEGINFLSEGERERVRATLARELGLTPTRRPNEESPARRVNTVDEEGPQ